MKLNKFIEILKSSTNLKIDFNQIENDSAFFATVKGIINNMSNVSSKTKDRQLLELIHQQILELKQDVAELKQDVAILKEEVAILKQDVAILKEEVAILKDEVSELKQDVSVLKREAINHGWNI